MDKSAITFQLRESLEEVKVHVQASNELLVKIMHLCSLLEAIEQEGR